MLESKDFSAVTDKKAPKTMAEIEANIWKDNIKSGRTYKDFLDASNEDFSQHKTKGIDGKDVMPSSFNIFRDSLRKTSEKLTETLNDNLPDMNLKEIEDSESEHEADEDDVLPLDFRTALIEKDNRIVIQAKPLQFKTDYEEDEGVKARPGLDSYLEMVRKEAFREDEGAIMIDPDININEQFEKIDLPCNRENRMNNTFNAPLRSQSNQSPSETKKRGPRGPKSHKTYDTDTDTNPASASDREEVKQGHRIPSTIKETYKSAAKTFAEAQTANAYQDKQVKGQSKDK